MESEMKIVFKDTTVTQDDAERLLPLLSGLTKLNEIMVLGAVGTTDLKKMINLEAAGRCREVILRRMIGRYLSLIRKDILESLGFDPRTPKPKGNKRGRPRKNPHA